MPKRTNPFQNLSSSIMAVLHLPDYLVEESVLEANPKTGIPREIDILITEVKNPANKKLVECRDWKRKQDIIWIDQLTGKAKSLGIKDIIAISSSGFHKTTLREAESCGIETMHLADAEDTDVKNWLFKIKEFGLNIDSEPVIKKVHLVSPNGIQPADLSNANASDIFLFILHNKQKISLSDYLKGIVTDPKIIEHVRTNNENGMTTYEYTIPCDNGVGYSTDGEIFVPLISITVYLDSGRKTYKIPMRHVRAGEHKILIGNIDDYSKLVVEEKEGQLVVMIENHGVKPNGVKK